MALSIRKRLLENANKPKKTATRKVKEPQQSANTPPVIHHHTYSLQRYRHSERSVRLFFSEKMKVTKDKNFLRLF
jgi:hypothetical protein